MKIGISIYSFYSLLKTMDIFEAIHKAKEIGFDSIEMVDFCLEKHGTDLAQAKQIKETCEKIGLLVSCYCVGGNFTTNDMQAEADKIKEMVVIANALGAPMLRHDVSGYSGIDGYRKNEDDLIATAVPYIRQITEFAQTKNVQTMTENHGFFMQDSYRVEKLVRAVNHENYGALVDIGNFLCADESPVMAVSRLAPYAMNVHIKDFIVKDGQMDNPGEGFFLSRGGNYLRGTIAGHGVVPIRQVIKILQRAGYDKVVTLEFEGMENALEAARIGLANIKGYLC